MGAEAAAKSEETAAGPEATAAPPAAAEAALLAAALPAAAAAVAAQGAPPARDVGKDVVGGKVVVADSGAIRALRPSEFAGLEIEVVEVCGLSLRILRKRSDFFAACAGDLPIHSTGLVLWECANLLADYLGYGKWLSATAAEIPWWQTHVPSAIVPTRYWTGRRVLELGGGCGVVACALACFGAHVVCTDGDADALRTAKQNAYESQRRNSKDWGSVEFVQLAWGGGEDGENGQAAKSLARELGPFEFIVGSDLLYGDKAPAQPLVDTLAALCREPACKDAEVILALKNRCADELSSFRTAVEAKELWDLTLADPDNLLEGFDQSASQFYGGDGRAYGVIHLKLRSPGGPGGPGGGAEAADATGEREAKRLRAVRGEQEVAP